MRIIQSLAISSILCVAACGGSSGSGAKVDSKDGAAGAAYDVQQTGQGLHDRSGSGLKPAQVDVPGGGGLSTNRMVTVQGKSGQAIITEKTDITSGSVDVVYSIKFEAFSDDGIETYNGQIDYTTSVNAEGVETSMKGSVDISGEKLAALEMDVHVKVTAANIELTGFITADGERFDYSGDVIALDGLD